MAEPKRLYRLPKEGRVIGVAAGLARYFELDATLVRIILIVLIFVTNGFVILLYFIAALILPTLGKEYPNGENFGESVSYNAKTLSKELETDKKAATLRNFFGVALIIFGAWLLLEHIFPDTWALRWDILWPVLLVLAGLFIVTRRRK